MRLALVTDPIADEALVAPLAAACPAGDVAAVILRLAGADARTLTDLVKRYAPGVQAHGAALVVACTDSRVELVTVATRGGADGVHVDVVNGKALAGLRALRTALPQGRILGAGGLRSRDDAMAAGEAGADYLLFGGAGRRDPHAVAEEATWWAEIFETPCIAVASEAAETASMAGTGAEFLGLGPAVWAGADGPRAVAAAQAALGAAEAVS